MTEASLSLSQTWRLTGLQSIREKILTEILVRAKTLVSTASRDPTRIPAEDLPFLTVNDGVESGRETAYRKHLMSLRVLCEYADRIDVETYDLSTAGNYMLATLISAIMQPDVTLGGLCEQIRYETSTIDYQEGGDSVIRVTVGFTVLYGFAIGNPYSLT